LAKHATLLDHIGTNTMSIHLEIFRLTDILTTMLGLQMVGLLDDLPIVSLFTMSVSLPNRWFAHILSMKRELQDRYVCRKSHKEYMKATQYYQEVYIIGLLIPILLLTKRPHIANQT